MRGRRFLCDRRGVAALEFALAAPVLAAVLVLGADGWLQARQVLDMRTALQTAARYYQSGGADDAVARATALAAWPGRPADGEVAALRACQCATAPSACDTNCPDGAPPSSFVTLSASSRYQGIVRSRLVTEREVVRVR